MASQQQQFVDLLALKTVPISLSFTSEPPAGVPRVSKPEPAGCAYWKKAAEGEAFYTTAEDHFGCAVGAYTHGAELGPAQQADLKGLLETMVGLSYLTMAEVPTIPVRKEKLAALTYAPLSKSPKTPDVVLVRGSPRVGMLLAEACHAAGLRNERAPVVRPACAMVPQVLETGRSTESFGCIGNRVYTGLSDSEVWYALPGDELDAILEKLQKLVTANGELERFHRNRLTAQPS
jgi:uncharacterized protein (DUF169 family)